MADTKLEVRVYPIAEPKGETKAFANVTFDDLVVIRGIRIADGEKGLFVSMPQSLDKKTNKSYDTAFPIDGDLRKKLNVDVLGEYNRVIKLAPEQRGYAKPDMEKINEINAADIKFEIRVYPLNEPKGVLKAFASLSVEDIVAIRGIRVVDSEKKGLFVSMPQSQNKNGEYYDTAFPVNGELRKLITEKILDEYNAAEKTAERKPTLAEGLRAGAAKAAEQSAEPRESASKSSRIGVLE